MAKVKSGIDAIDNEFRDVNLMESYREILDHTMESEGHALDDEYFTIKRDITGEGQAQYHTMGHGAYYGYTSPLLSIASGMMLGSMMSRSTSKRSCSGAMPLRETISAMLKVR